MASPQQTATTPAVATEPPVSQRRTRTWLARHANQIAFVLLCCAAAYRYVLIIRGWPVFDSDQAIIGLMGRHIWLHGEHPLFFYGQPYMGPGEAYAAVPFFALLGPSVFSLRLAMLPLILLFLITIYFVGRHAYGPVAGLLTLAWLVVGPSIAVYRSLVTEGGKQEALALGGLIMLCVWARLRLPERRPRNGRAWLACLAIYALLGAACGLALWSEWTIAPLILAAMLVLLLARTRELLSWAGAVLVLGFALAAWPFISFNVTHQFASLTRAIYFSGSGNGNGSIASHLAGIPAQFSSATAVGMPAVFGGPHVCVQSPSEAGLYRWMAYLGTPGDLCPQTNQLFSLLILAILALAAWSLLRALATGWRVLGQRLQRPLTPLALWRQLDEPLAEVDARRSASLWLRAIMLLNALALLFAFIYNPRVLSYPLDNTRYLVLVYLSAPLIIGTLWDTMRSRLGEFARVPGSPLAGVSAQPARPAQQPKYLAPAAGIFLALLLAFSFINGSAMLADSTDTSSFALPVDPPWVAKIITVFDTYHVHTFYSDNYYDCYRIAFETNERQVCAILDPNGQPAPETWLNRYPPYLAAVANDPQHAYLLQASPAEQGAFEHGPLPAQGYARIIVGNYAIYVYGAAATS